MKAAVNMWETLSEIRKALCVSSPHCSILDCNNVESARQQLTFQTKIMLRYLGHKPNLLCRKFAVTSSITSRTYTDGGILRKLITLRAILEVTYYWQTIPFWTAYRYTSEEDRVSTGLGQWSGNLNTKLTLASFQNADGGHSTYWQVTWELPPDGVQNQWRMYKSGTA